MKTLYLECQMGAAGDAYALLYRDAEGLDGLAFLPEDGGVEDDPVADDIDGSFTEDTRRNGVQHEGCVAEMDGVAGVGAALEAGHHGVAFRQEIHDLAFSFVSPLEPENYVEFHYYAAC